MTTTTRTRKTPATKAQTPAAAPEAPPVAPTPEPKPKARKPKLADVPVDGCSLNAGGTVKPCTEHKTYPSDPHCRNTSCDYDIRKCAAHVLEKGGKVQVQPVQQPQARARGRRTR